MEFVGSAGGESSPPSEEEEEEEDDDDYGDGPMVIVAPQRLSMRLRDQADFDEHRAEVRSFGCGGHDHREYDYRG